MAIIQRRRTFRQLKKRHKRNRIATRCGRPQNFKYIPNLGKITVCIEIYVTLQPKPNLYYKYLQKLRSMYV